VQLWFLEDQEDLVGLVVLKDRGRLEERGGLGLLEDLVARGLLIALLVLLVLATLLSVRATWIAWQMASR
jgi:hypothetical protein